MSEISHDAKPRLLCLQQHLRKHLPSLNGLLLLHKDAQRWLVGQSLQPFTLARVRSKEIVYVAQGSSVHTPLSLQCNTPALNPFGGSARIGT